MGVMKPAYNSCPTCGYKLKWRERMRLAPTVFRKVIPCPECEAALSWPKRPYRLMMTGVALLLLSTAPSRRGGGGRTFWVFLPLLPLLVVLIGARGLRVELHRPVDEQKSRSLF